jgi:hypothetical protein
MTSAIVGAYAFLAHCNLIIGNVEGALGDPDSSTLEDGNVLGFPDGGSPTSRNPLSFTACKGSCEITKRCRPGVKILSAASVGDTEYWIETTSDDVSGQLKLATRSCEDSACEQTVDLSKQTPEGTEPFPRHIAIRSGEPTSQYDNDSVYVTLDSAAVRVALGTDNRPKPDRLDSFFSKGKELIAVGETGVVWATRGEANRLSGVRWGALDERSSGSVNLPTSADRVTGLSFFDSKLPTMKDQRLAFYGYCRDRDCFVGRNDFATSSSSSTPTKPFTNVQTVPAGELPSMAVASYGDTMAYALYHTDKVQIASTQDATANNSKEFEVKKPGYLLMDRSRLYVASNLPGENRIYFHTRAGEQLSSVDVPDLAKPDPKAAGGAAFTQTPTHLIVRSVSESESCIWRIPKR